ncbi:MAG: hypothetical protein NTX26_02655 [Candidatus Parcubacteria bacterium]|nr:hypothetical protein [Candidatus Parcubacteria bacterium]
MRKSFIKIIAIALIVGLNWTGLSAVIETIAYFNDTETSLSNSYTAATLDFSLNQQANFSPNIIPTNLSTETIGVVNDGNLNFQYKIKVDNLIGDLCNYLELKASLGGIDVGYTGALKDFTYSKDEMTAPEDWIFTTNLTSSDPLLQNQTCTFDFIFDGWQTDLSDSSQGFSDKEIIGNVVTAGDWTPDVKVIYPNGGEEWYLVPGGSAWSSWCSAHGMNSNCEYPISWTATNKIGPDSDLWIDIYFSPDSGANWLLIVNDTENDGIYQWKIPYDVSYITGQARIKIEATHKVYPLITNWDMSDADFCPPLMTLDDLINWGKLTEEEQIATTTTTTVPGAETPTEEPTTTTTTTTEPLVEELGSTTTTTIPEEVTTATTIPEDITTTTTTEPVVGEVTVIEEAPAPEISAPAPEENLVNEEITPNNEIIIIESQPATEAQLVTASDNSGISDSSNGDSNSPASPVDNSGSISTGDSETSLGE